MADILFSISCNTSYYAYSRVLRFLQLDAYIPCILHLPFYFLPHVLSLYASCKPTRGVYDFGPYKVVDCCILFCLHSCAWLFLFIIFMNTQLDLYDPYHTRYHVFSLEYNHHHPFELRILISLW